MKMRFVVAALVLCCYCTPAKDKIQDFIPGIYTRSSVHEFGTEYDTLVITPQNGARKEYKVVRRFEFIRSRDGQRLEPEYTVETISAVYDPKHKLLHHPLAGDTYSFDIGAQLLFNGSIQYKKFK